jgi:folate-binding protein YgfZ
MKQDFLGEISSLALIRCSGPHGQTFLQAQLTNDVAKVTAGTSQYTGYCNPKGRLLATFLLWKLEDAYYLQLPSSLADSIVERLRKFILRAKVKLEDVTDQWRVFGLAGPNAATLLRGICGDVPVSPYAVMHHQNVSLLSLPGDRFQLVARTEQAQKLSDVFKEKVQLADAQVWNWLEIRAGIPTILPETQEQFVPQMVNFDLIGGVSFNKGCYPGQEIVARTKYLGQIKRRMYLANINSEEAPRPGDDLFSPTLDDQSAGMIVNSAPSPDGGHDVLTVLQTSVVQAEVLWKREVPLAFLPLPYQVT